jgi:VCBS repeat-containing protein
MTYCPPNAPQEHEFTALQGTDILANGDTNLNCGDHFTMPTGATACITVLDDDGTLSGDAWNNEWGDDHTWQIADIMVDSQLVHDGVGIYAEEYYVLHGDDGKCYYLIEIETSANGGADDTDDFYAFYGSVPPAGVELTVAGKGNVCGSWLDYKCMSAGLKWDLDTDGKVIIEAEDMALSGYKVDDMHAASGGEVIRLRKDLGEASVTFGAEAGTYDLELAYVDENDGEGEIEIWLNDTRIHVIQLDQNNNGNGNDWSTISTVAISDIELEAGDEIILRGQRDAWEMARIDALTFCKQLNEPPVAVDDSVTTDEDTPVSVDLLANDTDIDGDTLTLVSVDGQGPGTDITIDFGDGRTGVATTTTAGVLTFTQLTGFDSMAEGEVETFSLDYVINDGNGETAGATATVVINGVNDGPDAVDDMYTVSESSITVLDILTNDSDPENDPLTVTSITRTSPDEGLLVLNADGTVTFDTNGAFDALEDGQTATVTFEYAITDGQFTDTAVATITVEGEGVCPIEVTSVTGTGVTPDGAFTVTLDAPEITKDGNADFRISVNLGDTSVERYNFIFVVDVSLSTGPNGGNTFPDGQTVLEAEVEALQALTEDIVALGLADGSFTISLIPFSSTVNIVDPDPSDQNFNFVQTFGDDETVDGAAIGAAISLLQPEAETSYIRALSATNAIIAQQEAIYGDANNIVYFLSDGDPFPVQTEPLLFIEILGQQLQAQATSHAIGIGALVDDTTFLDPIDNTGGATLVNTQQELGLALEEAPVEDTVIVGATLNVFDSTGALADTFFFTGDQFDETPIGFELNLSTVDTLDFFVNETNSAELLVDLDGNNDGIIDDTVTLSVDIEGLLPLSTDL